MKLDVDALLTVPSAPPAAGPDRALDGSPPDPAPPAAPPDPAPRAAPPGKWAAVVAEFDGVVVEPDAAKPTEIPVAANTSAAAEIHRLLRLNGNRRSLGLGPGTVPDGLIGW